MIEPETSTAGLVTVEVVQVYKCRHCGQTLAKVRGHRLEIVCRDSRCKAHNTFPITEQETGCTHN